MLFQCDLCGSGIIHDAWIRVTTISPQCVNFSKSFKHAFTIALAFLGLYIW